MVDELVAVIATSDNRLNRGTVRSDWRIGHSQTLYKPKVPANVVSWALSFRSQFRKLRSSLGDAYRVPLAAHRAELDGVIAAFEAVVIAAGGTVPLDEEKRFVAFLPHSRALPTAPDNAVVPLPDLADYEQGRVHAALAEAVKARLYDPDASQPGMVELHGVAASGKTTTAFVVAFAFAAQPGCDCFYADFSETGHSDAALAEEFDAIAARGPRTLIVIDNANRREDLVEQLLARRERLGPIQPRVLIVRTPTTRSSTRTIAAGRILSLDSLATSVDAAHLVAMARFYVHKFGGREIAPATAQGEQWLKQFGGHLHAFSFALMARARSLGKGDDWKLDPRDADRWISEKWLHPDRHPPSAQALENLTCIAVFANQELELQVPLEALPHPRVLELQHFIDKGVVRQSDAFGARFQLVEPGWGALLLGAVGVAEAEQQQLLFDVASRSVILATVLDVRLSLAGSLELRARFRKHLAANPDFSRRVALTANSAYISTWSRFASSASAMAEALLSVIRDNSLRPEEMPIGELTIFTYLPFQESPAALEVRRILSEEIRRRLEVIEDQASELGLGYLLNIHDLFKDESFGEKLQAMISQRLIATSEPLSGERTMTLLTILKQSDQLGPQVTALAWAEILTRYDASPGFLSEMAVDSAAELLVVATRDGKLNLAKDLEGVIDDHMARAGTGAERVSELLSMRRFEQRGEAVANALANMLEDSTFPMEEISLQQVLDTNSALKQHDRKDALGQLNKALDRRDTKRLVAEAMHLSGGSLEHLFKEFAASTNFTASLRAAIGLQLAGLVDHYLEISLAEIGAFAKGVFRHIPEQSDALDAALRDQREKLVSLIRRSTLSQLAHATRIGNAAIAEAVVATLDMAEWERRKGQLDQSVQLGGSLAFHLLRGGASEFADALALHLAKRDRLDEIGLPFGLPPPHQPLFSATYGEICKIAVCCPDPSIRGSYLRGMYKVIRHAYRRSSFHDISGGVGPLWSFDRSIFKEIGWEWPWLFARIRRQVRDRKTPRKPDEERGLVQLLGAISNILDTTTIDRDLPDYVDQIERTIGWSALIAPHRENATRVEFRHFQFWLGMRYLDMRGRPLRDLDSATLRRTFELMQANLASEGGGDNASLTGLADWLRRKLDEAEAAGSTG